MNLNKCLAKKNNCYLRGDTMTPEGIVVHSTAANNTKLSRYVQPTEGNGTDKLLGANPNNNDWNRPKPDGVSKCVHAFIGHLADKKTVATYQILPWNYKSFGCGKGPKGSYNENYIQFEICEDDLKSKDYFEKVYKEAVELCAYLVKLYPTIKISNIVCHCEAHDRGYASNHGDVLHWFPKFGKNMDTFRKDVEKLVKETKPEKDTTSNVKEPEKKPANTISNKIDVKQISGTVKVTYDGKDGLNIRTEPKLESKYVKDIVYKGEVFTVVGITSDGAFYKLKSGLYITTNKKYVEFKEATTGKQYTTIANLHLREKADKSSKSYLVIPKGKKINITKTNGKWGQTTYDNKKGWVHMDYVK